MKVPNKILMILPLPPPIHGASLINDSILKSNVLKKNFQIRVIPMHFIKDNSEMGTFSAMKLLRSIKLYFKLVLQLIRFRPSLVYFNMATYGFALYRDIIVIIISKLFHNEIAIHLRTQRISDQVKSSKFKKYLFKSTFKNTSLILLSQYLIADVINVYDRKPFIVNDGIGYLNNKQAPQKQPSVTFLFLSNFLKTKGIFDLLNAAISLKEKSFKFQLIVAGKDAEITSQQIKKFIDINLLGDVVELRGPLYDSDKIRLYKEVNVFVLPTTFDAFPGVILEAMQFSLPVISTIEGSIPEIIVNNSTGVLINKGNNEELVKAMEYFIENPDQIELYGRRGKKRFNEKYTLAQFESSLNDVFQKVLNQSR